MFDDTGSVKCVKVPPYGAFTVNGIYQFTDLDLYAHGPGVSCLGFCVVDDRGAKVWSTNNYFELVE